MKVDEFYFPTDCVVLDTELDRNLSNHSPVILGRLFFATANAVIRCKNGVMTLSFGNMTFELNIFHNSFQPHVMDGHEEVKMIDISVVTYLRSLVMKIHWRNAWLFWDKILTLMNI